MDQLFSEIRARIPANKFYPPVLDPSHYLTRKRLLQTLKHRNSKITLLEAQAGQGKTILAAQYLEQVKARFAWYQIGTEDGDPVLLLTALLSCLIEALPGFRSPLLETMIAKGEVTPLELPRFANILLDDLGAFLTYGFHIVFDDLHLLESCEASLGLLGHVLETAPPKLRFVLAARRPVNLDMPVLKRGRGTVTVGNEELALTELEIAELYNDILKVPVAGKAVRELYEATEGWTMGLLLAAHALEKKGRLFSGEEKEKGNLRDYLHTEIFAGIPQALQKTLLRLSWLDQIPVALAAKLSEVPDIGSRLMKLSRRNFFIRSLDAKESVFRFHHLFQEYLQQRAEQELPQQEIQEILSHAAAWYLEQKRIEEALGYYLKAQNYEALEKVLEKEGMALSGMGRTGTLMGILRGVPEEVVRRRGYLSFFFGLALLNDNPPSALPYLERARETFAAGRNEVGELLALCQMINFLLYINCEYDRGTPLLRRAEKIYQKIHHILDSRAQIDVLLNISGGHAYFRGDLDAARSFAQRALDMTEIHGLSHQLVMARFNIGMVNCFAGRWEAFKEEIEKTFIISGSPHLGSLTKLWLLNMPLNYHAISGDLEKFNYQADHLRENLKWNVMIGSAAEPFNILFENDGSLGRGELGKAWSLVEKGLSLGMAAANSHLQSQFLHYKAYIASLLGERETAILAAKESLRLRQLAGGKVFVTLNEMIIGGTFVQLGIQKEAEAHLAKAIEGSRELKEEFLRAGAFAHRAFLKLQLDDPLGALDDTLECLRCMRENNYPHFFSWTPALMKSLLELAVREGGETKYARYLARERLGLAILSDGTSIPLLQINTLGDLSLSIEDNVVLKAEGLTQAQRDLLALLIASPGLKKCQEKIQVVLWPDSTPEKARANFDNLLMRLRKTLSQAIKPHSVKHYLSLQKGILCLENCRIDSAEFAGKARKGLEHARRKEFWQAGNAFFTAHNLWKGAFLPNGSGAEEVQDYRDELDRLFIESTCRWSAILTEAGRFEEAVKILERAVQHHPTNDDLVRCLYRLHCESDKPAQAWQVLKQYESALRMEDYSPGEIEEILQAVFNSAT